MSDKKKLLHVLRKEQAGTIPFWFMRQAGRYLPEYKELRATTKGFLDFCYSPEKASEATLQPIRRFGMDGAIIFSDILVIPHKLGMDVRFEEGHGPVLTPLTSEKNLAALKLSSMVEKLEPVYEALRLTRAKLPAETALIGFAGAPWTLACYMIEGSGSRDFQKVRLLSESNKPFFSKVIDLLTEAVSQHAIKQIEAGAEVFQLFDSWSGVLSETQFEEWVIAPAQKIVAKIKAKYPKIPIIGFPRMAGMKYVEYTKYTGVDAVNIDGSVSLSMALEKLSPLCIIQGNLDPTVLAENKDAMLKQAKKIIDIFKDKPFVFNLGHGILPHTPIENVQALSQFIKSYSLST